MRLPAWTCGLASLLAVVAARAPARAQSQEPPAQAGSTTPTAAAPAAPPTAPAAGQSAAPAPTAAPAATPAPEAAATSAAPAAATPATPDNADEQVISDPELAAAAPSAAPSSAQTSTASTSASNANNADARVVLHSRVATETQRTDPRQDVWQSTTLATFDATVRRSDALRFVLGLRARYHYASLASNSAVVDTVPTHYDLDALPTAGYVDGRLAQGLHLQVGYQPVHLGRFDIFSATNVLAVHDLRDGPATMAEAGEVGQIAAVMDYDANAWLSFRAIYLPFFTPHIISVVESDYALLRMTQVETTAAYDAADMGSGRLQALLLHNLTRGDRDRIAQTGLSAFAPEASLAQPQGALRASAHGPSGEVAVTAATALEHLPALRASSTLIDYLAVNAASNSTHQQQLDAQTALAGDNRPLAAEYKRYAVFSADAATDLGPLSVGLEGAYMLHRTLMAESLLQQQTSEPQLVKAGTPGLAQPASSDVLQVGARAEYVRGTEWLVSVEAFFAYTLSAPSFGPKRYMMMEDGRFARGVGTLLSYAPDALPIHFEVGAGLFSGPSLLVSPRVAYSIVDNFDVELGALFVNGPAGTTTMALGTRYDNVDQVYLGLRYLP